MDLEDEHVVSPDQFEDMLNPTSPPLQPEVKVQVGGRVWDPLVYACEVDMVEQTLGSMKRFGTPLHERFQRSINQVLLDKSDQGDISVVEALLDAGADPYNVSETKNVFGEWVLGGRNCAHIAAMEGRSELLALLCSRFPSLLSSIDTMGNTVHLIALQMVTTKPKSSKHVTTLNCTCDLMARFGVAIPEQPSEEEIRAMVRRDKEEARRRGPEEERERLRTRAFALRRFLEETTPSGDKSSEPIDHQQPPQQSVDANSLIAKSLQGPEYVSNPAPVRVIFVHGSGCSWASHWYESVATAVRRATGVSCQLPYKPMPTDCKGSMQGPWVDYLLHDMYADENCIVVGHSSGANAALRLGERIPLRGMILVAATYTPLDIEEDKEARAKGVKDEEFLIVPFNVDAILRNMGRNRIVLIHGEDDDVVPVAGARDLARDFGDKIRSFLV